jgi:phage baseplate assembly protein W
MAIIVQNRFPNDSVDRTAIGVDLPFNAPAVFRSNYLTRNAIKNNLINFFLTNQNERYLNPTFGGNLRAFVFQQISDGNLESLKEDIQSQLKLYFPNVVVGSLDIDSIPDAQQVNIILKYNIIDTGLTDTLEIAFT